MPEELSRGFEQRSRYYGRVLEDLSASEFVIPQLGDCRFDSPDTTGGMGEHVRFIDEGHRIVFDDHPQRLARSLESGYEIPTLELAGPRRKVYFDPEQTTCGIVTCGGLCPGLNDVIRGLVMQAHYRYGVKRILGFRFGYQGMNPDYGHEVLELTPDMISHIHRFGGTFLGTSRGPQSVPTMVDRLIELGVNILFVVGGDGTLRGGAEISEEALRRGHPMAVVGVPKTIDNDILFLDKSFGYETAFSVAVDAVTAAHTEAQACHNGIGLVKLMGRHSGFIVCGSALATGEANFVLIPEVPFQIEGPGGLLQAIERRLEERGHAVILVAEGAGQDLMSDGLDIRDASGNVRLKDIGAYLKNRIESHFREHHTRVDLKYIDPSYIIRSAPASPQDRLFCWRLAQNAVHAAMAGRTAMVIGRWHHRYVHLPIRLVTKERKCVDPSGDLWLSVLENTGQASVMS